MSKEILGIHHVTAIAGEPQENVDFYAGILGLRLVKQTVNYDDPGTYHLYYGDELGHPGTIMTFFPWPGARRGQRGTGQVTVTSFSVPEGSFSYWTERFKQNDIAFEDPVRRFDEEVLTFLDPDGLVLELVSHARADERSPWKDGPIPQEHAIRGFYGVTITVEGYERTASLLTQVLGFRYLNDTSNRFRYEAGPGGSGTLIDVLCLPYGTMGRIAVGTVHHVAWRVAKHEEQKALREEIAGLGFNVTPVINRNYFHSIYFREPGGVLFEIATDPPGFTVDESPEQLGTKLQLPPWLEPNRAKIEQILPPLRLPKL
ncbi:MAG TPA: ring-cleaving dioxygenase [Thermodesulfobacteriota bacterium]|nr:ring-cleaving dioxygenase [Thermodesulfobacteriota bacterium]